MCTFCAIKIIPHLRHLAKLLKNFFSLLNGVILGTKGSSFVRVTFAPLGLTTRNTAQVGKEELT